MVVALFIRSYRAGYVLKNLIIGGQVVVGIAVPVNHILTFYVELLSKCRTPLFILYLFVCYQNSQMLVGHSGFELLGVYR